MTNKAFGLKWKSTQNARGGETLELTPDIPGDGYFADGTPYWRTTWLGNSNRRYPGLVSTFDGEDVFANNRGNYSRFILDAELSVVAPDFTAYVNRNLYPYAKLVDLPYAAIVLWRDVTAVGHTSLRGTQIVNSFADGCTIEPMYSSIKKGLNTVGEKNAFWHALDKTVPLVDTNVFSEADFVTVGDTVAEFTPKAQDGDILEIWPKGGNWSRQLFVREGENWEQVLCPVEAKKHGFKIEEVESGYQWTRVVKLLTGETPSFSGLREATFEELTEAKKRAQTTYASDQEKLQEVIAAIEAKLATFVVA